MYLKTLYIQGFKSFAQKTKIEFNNKITGIVGPNGSGKSNISDAIMWVLGETSVKSLRGSKMEDVIFSGTDSKRPLGFAEVSIVFDNTDRTLPLEYNEISVTRRMYRSLESEFLINNVKCRLKDIKELFMDTGIGKDGYSLIGQGKIESILSNRPEQRRAVFEEAAGISKYKMRKLETENKLKRTEDNIVRLNDIISEIKQREEILKVESENAIKYKELFNELKTLEITNAFTEIDKYKLSKDKLDEKENTLNSQEMQLKESLEAVNSEKISLEGEIAELESKIEEFQKLEVEDNRNYERLISQLSLISEKKEFTKNTLEQNRGTLSELNKNIDDREKTKIVLQENLKVSVDNEREVLDSIELLQRDLNLSLERRSEIEKSLEQDNAELIKLHREKSEIDSKVSISNSLIEEKKSRLENLNKNLKTLNENNLEIENSLKEILLKKSKLSSESTDLEGKKEALNSDINSLEVEVNSLEKNLLEYKTKFERENARYIALKNLSENYEGYNKSVKSFMNYTKKRENFSKSLVGPVADNIKVDEKYEKAISVALGGSLQNIIIESEQDAKEMIKLLNREKLGRVTFLPINRMSSKAPSIKLESFKESGILGFAYDLVSFDQKYDNVFKNLLGRIVVATDFDSALDFSKKTKNSYRIVTLNGDSLNIGGSITGGNISKHNTEILSRKNEIDLIKEEVKNVQNLYNETLAVFESKTKSLEDLQLNLNSAREELFKVSSEMLSLENTYNNINVSKDNNDSYLKKYNIEREEIETSILEDEKILKDNREKLIEIEKVLSNKSEVNISVESDLNNIKQEIDIKVEKVNEEKLKLVKIQNEIENIAGEIKRLEADNSSDNIKIENILVQNKNFALDVDIREAEEKKIKEDLEEMKELLSEKSKKIIEEKLLKDEKKELHSKSLESSFKYQNDLFEIERKITKLNSDREKFEYSINSILDKMKIEYEIEEEDIENLVEYKSHKLLLENIEKLKNNIRKLGEVNIFSIEEYKSVSERLQFNLEQKEDLLNSKEEIQSIIKKLDSEMKILFKESFIKISKYFNEIFRILFNGGRAEIEIDGDDELSSGIEIKAQPPGKRFQSLSLLSGGERSLTAVALLFALLKVRPAPFCILDEIDAALDDANIKRYADYLMTLKDMQFIIITHRKLTMEIANVLYGVTMEEKGVSKIISVELKD